MASTSAPPPRQGAQPGRAPRRATPEHNGSRPRASTPDKGNGPPAPDPAVVAASASAERQAKGGIEGLIGRRVAAATEHALEGPNQTLMRAQKPIWDALCKYYFRLETSGWERLPEETSLLIGNHSGGSLTMDAWTFVFDWWRRFGTERVLHATAHDVLMAAPGLGDYFRHTGVIPASREGVSTALSAGCDVVIWPGGDVDAMRNWRRRDEAVLGGRMGFVRTAIRSGVPIVPVATVGGHDTAFVVSEGRWIANGLDRVSGLKTKLRGSQTADRARLPVRPDDRDDSDAPSAPREDPHRAAGPDSRRPRPRAGQRSRVRHLDLSRSGIRNPERNGSARQAAALPGLRLVPLGGSRPLIGCARCRRATQRPTAG